MSHRLNLLLHSLFVTSWNRFYTLHGLKGTEGNDYGENNASIQNIYPLSV